MRGQSCASPRPVMPARPILRSERHDSTLDLPPAYRIRSARVLDAYDRHSAGSSADVFQRRILAGCDRWNGRELQCPADNSRDRDRHVFACRRWAGHAGREAQPALRRATRVPYRGGYLRRGHGADDVQPERDGHDCLPGPGRDGGGGARALARRIDCRQLPRAPASDCARCARIRARRRRRRGVPDRRHPRHVYRLAAGVRHSDRAVGDRFLAQLSAQGRRWPARSADRLVWRCSRRSGDHLNQLRLQQPEQLGARARASRCVVRRFRLVARTGHDRHRHRARPCVPDVDA